jgi:hypothetical protein
VISRIRLVWRLHVDLMEGALALEAAVGLLPRSRRFPALVRVSHCGRADRCASADGLPGMSAGSRVVLSGRESCRSRGWPWLMVVNVGLDRVPRSKDCELGHVQIACTDRFRIAPFARLIFRT